MATTNLVWLTSSSDVLTDANKAQMEKCLADQADYVSQHLTSLPRDRRQRGVGLFQQIEDPAVALETSHWDSEEQHGQWLASPEYKASSATLASHFDFSKLDYFYIDEAVMAPPGGEGEGEGELSFFDAPVVSVGKVTVAAENKEAFQREWEKGTSLLREFVKPYVCRWGWRLRKEDPNVETFVLITGWPSIEKETVEFPQHPEYMKVAGALVSYATGSDIKHFKRVI